MQKKTFLIFFFLFFLSACAGSGFPGADAGGSLDSSSSQGAFFKFITETVMFLLSVALVYYMLVTRPKELEEDARDKFLSEAKKGNKVILNSGIIGKIQNVSDEYLQVEIAPNVKVKIKPEFVKPFEENDSPIKESTKK